MPDFKSGAFNHSTTAPSTEIADRGRACYPCRMSEVQLRGGARAFGRAGVARAGAASFVAIMAACAPASVDVGERVRVETDPLRVVIATADGGELVLQGVHRGADFYYEEPQILPGWDGYRESVKTWQLVEGADVVEADDAHAVVETDGGTLTVREDGPRVRLSFALEPETAGVPAKTSLTFGMSGDEGFFGLGERFAEVNHRGKGLYTWAEEGGLGGGEDPVGAAGSPFPNGPSMTYFPVPFFLSSAGYAVHLDTTVRTEVHLGDESPRHWRAAVSAADFDVVVYAAPPLQALDMYTEDTGRPMIPAPWVWGPRRRVDALDDDEWHRLRDSHVPTTGIDDAVHFLPHLSQAGREDELRAWTSRLHDAGFKVMAYNNPYVSMSEASAAADFGFGRDHGFFLTDDSGAPAQTFFISGTPQTLATVDLTDDDAVAWFQSLLKRTLDIGYDGWMHDFGEYTGRAWHAHDGSTGESLHNRFPVLSAKAAHDLLERERPDDYLFFVRSGGSGTQAFVPAVWGGDAEATFDDTQGIPSALRSGLSLGMSGVPYWGSDGTGFKCLTNYPRDKEVYLRWAELMAVSPIMMEQNACSNPLDPGRTKWTLWSDEETTETYAKMARLHTRLQPYFEVLARQAHETGVPVMRHPFLVHPDAVLARDVDDAFYLGPSLYALPIVRRGETAKSAWLPPGRFVDLDDGAVYEGDGLRDVVIPAPLTKLPLLVVENQLVPMLDASIETLGATDDPAIVTPDKVADRLDVVVALGPGGAAEMTLTDGTLLSAHATASKVTGPLAPAGDDLEGCARCFAVDRFGDVERIRANGALAADDTVLVDGVELRATGPVRRVRWTVLRMP